MKKIFKSLIKLNLLMTIVCNILNCPGQVHWLKNITAYFTFILCIALTANPKAESINER